MDDDDLDWEKIRADLTGEWPKDTEVHPNPDHPTRRAARLKDRPIFQTSQPSSMQQSNMLKRMGQHVGANNMGRTAPDLRELDELLHQSRGGCIVVWTSNHRFTYAAVHAAGKWFITGRGDYYGGNEFTHQQFVYQVLGHSDVTSIYVTTDVQTLFTR